uniref:Uncharacterized protein n=1 Tax=Vespula pensylvanica TaxID=30213 RepID=A0A834PBM2_VESPE|nr:hypothetical protein H0235_002770 [Vespula pensylvanica]
MSAVSNPLNDRSEKIDDEMKRVKRTRWRGPSDASGRAAAAAVAAAAAAAAAATVLDGGSTVNGSGAGDAGGEGLRRDAPTGRLDATDHNDDDDDDDDDGDDDDDDDDDGGGGGSGL